MTTHASIEQMERRWIAYVPGLLGCFASSEDRELAIKNLPAAVRAYLDWFEKNGWVLHGISLEEPILVDEVVQEWLNPETGEANNAFFASDAPPLQDEEVVTAAALLRWTYRDLLSELDNLPEEVFRCKVEGNWSIAGILNHTARGEGWYLERLGCAPEGFRQVEDPRALLYQVHTRMLEILPSLVGKAQVIWVNGELWSPRKMLRRSLWHRRDHTDHIKQFKQKMQGTI